MTKTVGKHCFNIFDLIGDTSNLNPAMVYPEEWFGTWQCIRLHYSLHRFGDPAIIRLFPLVVPEFQPLFRLNPVPVYVLQAIHIKENVWTCFVHLYPQISQFMNAVFRTDCRWRGIQNIWVQSHCWWNLWQVLPGQSFEGHSHWRWTLGKSFMRNSCFEL